MSLNPELTRLSACTIVDMLKSAEVSPLDLLDAIEARVSEVDPQVNALPTLCFDRARERARALMRQPIGARGQLAGLPVPIKDLVEVEGVRTTFGSPIFADNIPVRSNLLVQNLENEGGVVYAKSAVPEFGAGGHTFSEVFGATRNPWDMSRSAAGSSGGAAVALATGMAWVAHGNDMGGSLRNPASFCGVVGLRPSPGRVARDPGTLVDSLLGADGPMGRSVADTALLLDAMTGEHAADPLSLPRTQVSFLQAAREPAPPLRVGFSTDLGITPVDPEVASVCRAAVERMSRAGVQVEEAFPDLSEASEAFQVLRAFHFAASHAQKLHDFPQLLKPEVVWNIEKGLRLTVPDLLKAEAQRAAMIQRTNQFFEVFDLLLTPATIVPAFPIDKRYVESCDGHVFNTYIDWLAIAYAITLTTAPALSLPCGFTSNGLPVGLQVVARPRAEAKLLSHAAFIEELLEVGSSQTIAPRSPGSLDPFCATIPTTVQGGDR